MPRQINGSRYSRINPVKLWKTAFKNFEEVWSAYLWKTVFKNFTWSIHEYLDPNNYSYGLNMVNSVIFSQSKYKEQSNLLIRKFTGY